MYDRIPSPGKENRVSITQDNGQVITGVLAYADDATQEGSAYTKGNVLPDDVCMLMNLDPDPSEPDDAFRYLGLMDAEVFGGIAILVSSKGAPVAGISFSVSGTGTVTTDSQGRVFLKKPPGSYTATFTNTLDLIFSPSSIQLTSKAGSINYYEVEVEESSVTRMVFTVSKTINFSDRVADFDVFCVGGGGSGGAAAGANGDIASTDAAMGATGGAGGFTATKKGIVPSGPITIIVGSGGAAAVLTGSKVLYGNRPVYWAADGSPGGETKVSMGGEVICSAKGGGGGEALAKRWDASGGSCDGASGGSGSGGAFRSVAGDSGYDGSDGEDAGSYYTGGTGQGYTTAEFGESGKTVYAPAGGSCAGKSVSSTPAESAVGSVGFLGAEAFIKFTGKNTEEATGKTGFFNGSGGGAVMIVCDTPPNIGEEVNYKATSGAGTVGAVVIRWRYK